jgi:cytochrome c peroxidase
MVRELGVLVCLVATGCVADVAGFDDGSGISLSPSSANGSKDDTGFGDTFDASGSIDTSNAFFTSLGTNGRSCATCHVQSEGWTITPAGLQARFKATDGTDPVFRTNDGTVSPNADVSTASARRSAYKMLLSKGLIRVGIGIPAGAEFSLVAVDDPYKFASAAQLSLFRRPLPSTNLAFLSTVMWDGRETNDPADLDGNLTQQATDATLGHALATGADPGQMRSIAAFEAALFTAQTQDHNAGKLDKSGAAGGPKNLANEPFFVGINDPLGHNPQGTPFDPVVFTLFDAWAPDVLVDSNRAEEAARNAIYRGQQIFNTRQFQITGVGGLNDVLGQPSITGTCSLCHNTPNVGAHSVPLPLNLGVSDASLRTSDMPLYTLRNNSTGETVQTTDPGRALITGKWADIGKFKGPILRGLAMRAPYFHNGSAASLSDAVAFYNSRFNMGLSAQDQSDLVAFLSAL